MDVVGQACRVDVRRQDEGLGQVDEGEVVLQVLRAETGMDGDVLGKTVLVRLRLDRLLRVPLAGADLDVGRDQMTAKRKCQICLFANEDHKKVFIQSTQTSDHSSMISMNGEKRKFIFSYTSVIHLFQFSSDISVYFLQRNFFWKSNHKEPVRSLV